MITLITGLTGSGKTWFGVKKLFQDWKGGATIWANFPLCFPNDNERVHNFSQLAELYHLTNGVIFIDEAQKLLDARRWASLPMSFAEMIAQHRKHFLDIYTTTQDIGHIDVRLRALVHELFQCQTIIRIPRNERKHPILQIIRITKKIRNFNSDTDRIVWVKQSSKLFFISSIFTKKLYETYADVGLTRYATKTYFKLGKWKTRIINRDLVNSGRRRLR